MEGQGCAVLRMTLVGYCRERSLGSLQNLSSRFFELVVDVQQGVSLKEKQDRSLRENRHSAERTCLKESQPCP